MGVFDIFTGKEKRNRQEQERSGAESKRHMADALFNRVSFDTSELEYLKENDEVRFWQSPAGDLIGLYHFPVAPSIDADLGSIDSVRQFYRQVFAEENGAIIQVDTFVHCGCPGIFVLGKLPQEPSGMTYVGTITVPFRDFSYVVKATCPEHGTTGTRDSLVMMALMQEEGDVGDVLAGWGEDPYDPHFTAPLLRSKSEEEGYDVHFPDHPLSRLRQIMNLVVNSLEFDRSLQDAPPFAGCPEANGTVTQEQENTAHSELSEEVMAMIENNTTYVKDRFSEALGFVIDCDFVSLEAIESVLDSLRLDMDEERKNELQHAVGSFLGQTIIAVYGGRWVEDVYGYGVEVMPGKVAYPFAKMDKFMAEGMEESFTSLLSVIGPLFGEEE